jgi:hypothetical protein
LIWAGHVACMEEMRNSYKIIIVCSTVQIIYRVKTKELYTFKMIQKANSAYLELHTYTS